jgi:hypothetical protein
MHNIVTLTTGKDRPVYMTLYLPDLLDRYEYVEEGGE